LINFGANFTILEIYFHFNTLYMRHLKAFTLLLTSLILQQVLLQDVVAQQPAGAANVQGAWRVTHPVNGHLYLIVREQRIVSYFWQYWEGERVLRSEWKAFGNGIYFALDSGDKIILSRSDAGVEAFFFNPGRSMTGAPDFRTFALRVSSMDVGKWHRPVSRNASKTGISGDEQVDDSFFGTWEVISSRGLPYHIVVERDRTAATSWPHSDRGVSGMRGSWQRQGSELHIVWDTGHYDILRKNEGKYHKIGYPPSVSLESVEPEPQPALKVEWLPHDPWRALYVESRNKPASNQWKSAKNASKFFRGDWKLLSSPGEMTKLELGRFGGIRGVRKGKVQKGEWKCTADYAILRWEDGTTELIRPLGDYFVTMLYSPLKNLDSVPDQVCPVDPLNRKRWFKLPKLFASGDK